jgi:penicillin amidase
MNVIRKRAGFLQDLQVITIILILWLLSGCASILGGIFNPQYKGEVRDLGVQKPVQIIRDEWGIPHIRAETEEDLMFAQGYIHAQERLWQMELFRRLTQGRLAELAGEAGVMSDFFVRLIGFDNVSQRAAQNLTWRNRSLIRAYTDGINAFLESEEISLPIELRLLGKKPAKWTV